MGWTKFDFRQCAGDLSSPSLPDRFWRPLSLLSVGDKGLYSGDRRVGRDFDSCFHSVLRLEMPGTMLVLSHQPLLKQRGKSNPNLTFSVMDANLPRRDEKDKCWCAD